MTINELTFFTLLSILKQIIAKEISGKILKKIYFKNDYHIPQIFLKVLFKEKYFSNEILACLFLYLVFYLLLAYRNIFVYYLHISHMLCFLLILIVYRFFWVFYTHKLYKLH